MTLTSTTLRCLTQRFYSQLNPQPRIPVLNYLSNARRTHHVCVIGSGPAGFYVAQQILKTLQDSRVDIYEKLPMPFGLVRYGVAPDHPEVKNVINTFTTVLKNPRVSFIGNIEVGKDVTFSQLRQSYNAIVLCYGASEDRKLGLVNESQYVIPGRDFVGWYNGLPENHDLKVDLENSDRAVIIGQGNVALDIARILLSSVDILRKTDISTYALEALVRSKVKYVTIYGRRGPLQVAFTIKELRELVNLSGIRVTLNPADFYEVNEDLLKGLPRPKKRLTELLYKTAHQDPVPADRILAMKFLRSPILIQPGVTSRLRMTFGVNSLDDKESAVDSGQREIEDCDLVFRSVGYKGRRLFDDLPFDERRGIIPNDNGKVEDGVYCCGWVSQGPRGVILSTMQNAFDVGKRLGTDLTSDLAHVEKPGLVAVRSLIPSAKRLTSFTDYQKIAEYEHKTGTKVTTIEDMLRIANDTRS